MLREMTVKSTVAHVSRGIGVRCFRQMAHPFPDMSDCPLARHGAVRSPASMTWVTPSRNSYVGLPQGHPAPRRDAGCSAQRADQVSSSMRGLQACQAPANNTSTATPRKANGAAYPPVAVCSMPNSTGPAQATA